MMADGDSPQAERSGAMALPAGIVASLLLGLTLALLGTTLEGQVARAAPADSVAVGPVCDSHQLEIGAIYASFVREAREGGGLRVHDHQTAQPHSAGFLRPWEWALGQLLYRLQWPAARAIELERLFACFAAGASAVLLSVVFLKRFWARALLVFAVLFSGNLYFLVERLGRDSGLGVLLRSWLDSTDKDLSGLGFAPFAAHLGVPHVSLELSLFATAIASCVASARRRSVALAAVVGLVLAALVCVRPYTLPIAAAGCAAAWLPSIFERTTRARGLAALLVMGLPPLPLALDIARVLRSDSPFAALDVYHPAPNLLEFAFFFGPWTLLVPLVLWSRARHAAGDRARHAAGDRARHAAGDRARHAAGDRVATFALTAWACVQLAMLHGEPLVNWEVEVAMPLALLAALIGIRALEGLAERVHGDPSNSRRLQLIVGALALIAVGAGAIGAFAWWGERVKQGGDHRDRMLLLEGERAALAFIERDRGGRLPGSSPNAVLVASPGLSTLAPWLAGVRVLRGHPDHTPTPRASLGQVVGVLSGARSLDEARQLGVTHVLIGPREHAMGAMDHAAAATHFGVPAAFEFGPVRVWRLGV